MTEPTAYAIYGRKTGALRHVVQDEDIAIEMSEHYDVRPLYEAAATLPADDVREALTAARNVEQYLDMLALDADDRVHVVIDDGYDGDGVIQSLEVPDLRTLVAFAREVRPRGTVTDAEADVPPLADDCDCEDRETLVRPEGLVCGTCGKVIEARP